MIVWFDEFRHGAKINHLYTTDVSVYFPLSRACLTRPTIRLEARDWSSSREKRTHYDGHSLMTLQPNQKQKSFVSSSFVRKRQQLWSVCCVCVQSSLEDDAFLFIGKRDAAECQTSARRCRILNDSYKKNSGTSGMSRERERHGDGGRKKLDRNRPVIQIVKNIWDSWERKDCDCREILFLLYIYFSLSLLVGWHLKWVQPPKWKSKLNVSHWRMCRPKPSSD